MVPYTLDELEYVRLYELWQASEACLRAIGLPEMLGGPDLPPEVNRLIAATAAVRADSLERPALWQEPEPTPDSSPF